MTTKSKLLSLKKASPKSRSRGDITNPKTFEIAKRFQSYQRKTAESIIEMGRIVIEAKGQSQIEFDDFCLLIGYDGTSSTIRKLAAIGEKYEYLITRSECLPPNWTVIYEIARLGEEQIEDYINSNKITSTTTGNAVEKLLIHQNLKANSKNSKVVRSVPNGTLNQLMFSAKLSDLEHPINFIYLEEIFKNLLHDGFDLEVSDSLREAINKSKTIEMMEGSAL